MLYYVEKKNCHPLLGQEQFNAENDAEAIKKAGNIRDIAALYREDVDGNFVMVKEF